MMYELVSTEQDLKLNFKVNIKVMQGQFTGNLLWNNKLIII